VTDSIILRSQGVVGEDGMDAVFQGGTHTAESHAGTGKLAIVSDLSGRYPDGGEAAETKEGGQTCGIKFVSFIDVSHHELGLGGMGEQRGAAGSLDLIGDPVPVADAFQGDGSMGGEVREEGVKSPRVVIDAETIEDKAVGILDLDLGVMLVRVTSDRKLLHREPPDGRQ
jgi:hypothetical protein